MKIVAKHVDVRSSNDVYMLVVTVFEDRCYAIAIVVSMCYVVVALFLQALTKSKKPVQVTDGAMVSARLES